jgi:hypothetical protein
MTLEHDTMRRAYAFLQHPTGAHRATAEPAPRVEHERMGITVVEA